MDNGVLNRTMADLIAILGVMSAILTGTKGVMEYCEGETFRAMCDGNEAVVMTHAQYGRMSLGRCVNSDYGNIGCASDVTGHMDAWCSGRQECEVRVSSIVDAIRTVQQPCPRDFRSYLEAAYQCLQLTQPSGIQCEGHELLNITETGETVGYLARVTTERTAVGSIACPWRLVVSPGKMINFTLFDFATALRDPYNFEMCQQVYATIKDADAVTTVKVCTGSRRVAHAYLSQSNSVEVRIFTQEGQENSQYFILKYEAVGCSDPEAPLNGWVERVGQVALVKCNGTTATWELHCRENAWQGEMFSECPPEGHVYPLSTNSEDAAFGDVLWNFVSGAHEFSIVIIASIAVIIACAILTLGLICIKRRRELQDERRGQKEAESHPPGYYEAAPKVDPRIQSRGVPGLPGEAYPPNENDYYRTWQLQRHAQNPQYSGQHFQHGGGPSHQGHYTTESDSAYFGDYQGQVEHIYESPKFAHKDLDLQYYELDPSLTVGSDLEPDRRRSSAMSGGL